MRVKRKPASIERRPVLGILDGLALAPEGRRPVAQRVRRLLLVRGVDALAEQVLFRLAGHLAVVMLLDVSRGCFSGRGSLDVAALRRPLSIRFHLFVDLILLES